jgi:hypothetical protein
MRKSAWSASSLFSPSTGGVFIKQVVKETYLTCCRVLGLMVRKPACSASSLFCPSTGGVFIKQVVKNLLDMLYSLGVDGEEARLVSQLPVLPQHGLCVHQTGSEEPT